MDKPTVNAQLVDAGILSGIAAGRVAKKVRGDVLGLLAQLRDQLTAKLNSDAVMTDWQRQRSTDLLKFSQATIDGAYEKIGKKTVADLDGLSDVEVQKLTKTVNDAVGVELSARMAPQQLEAIASTDKLLVQGATQKAWWSKQSADLQHNFSTQIKLGMAQGKTIPDMVKATKDLIDTKHLVVVRKNISVQKGELVLFEEIKYFFYITNHTDYSAEQIVALANERCEQENVIEQLKNGVNAMRMPVDDLMSNWAYMVMSALAWNLKSWYGLLLPNRQRGLELVRMEFRRFLHAIVLLPAQIVRSGRKIIYRIMGYNSWLKDFFSAWEKLRRMAPA